VKESVTSPLPPSPLFRTWSYLVAPPPQSCQSVSQSAAQSSLQPPRVIILTMRTMD
jgi:hypothetical protein